MKFEVLVEIRLWVRFVVLDSIFRMSDESGLNWSIGIEDWIGWMRIEICNVVRIWIECIDCIRESISMVFVMNRSVLEC